MERYQEALLLILSTRNITKNANANCGMWAKKHDVQDIVLQITDGCNIFCLETLYWLRYLTHSDN
jgi:hypothetical protein